MKRVNLANAWSKEYADVLRKIQNDKICPFCMEHFLKYHTKPILKNGRHWVLTENFNPYPGTKHHLLIVSKKHVLRFEKLSTAAHSEFFAIIGTELKKRKVQGGTMFMRFGDTDYTGASVEHLHAQLVSGTKRGKNTEPLLTPVGNKTKKPRSAGPR